MIASSELMIGNIVMGKNRICRVDAIWKDGIRAMTFGKSERAADILEEYLMPIPITINVLLALGFHEQSDVPERTRQDQQWHNLRVFWTNGYYICTQNDGATLHEFTPIDDDYYHSYFTDEAIMGIHDLQNRIFFSTRKRLDINPKLFLLGHGH